MIPKITVAGDDPVNSCAEGPLPALSPGFGVKAENRFSICDLRTHGHIHVMSSIDLYQS